MAALTLLEIVQKHCRTVGIPLPATVLGSNDKQIQQMRGLMDDFLLDLEVRGVWQHNVRTATFTTQAAELQGVLTTLAPDGFRGIIAETMYNRTEQRQIAGGSTPQQWQNRKALNFLGPFPEYRVMGGSLYFLPAPTAGQTVAFEYYSNFFVQLGQAAIGGPGYADAWTFDSDFCVCGDALPRLWLAWAWRKAKGFDYAEEFASYERMMAVTYSRQNHGRKVVLDCAVPDRRPGLILPESGRIL